MKPEYFEAPAERDARTIREARQALRNSQKSDPLRKREQTVKFWKECQKTNKHYTEPHCRALYRNIGFWPYLMPKLSAMLIAKRKGQMQAKRDELTRQCQEWQHKKALKKAQPLSLFPEAA
jgi:hypothetical protein